VLLIVEFYGTSSAPFQSRNNVLWLLEFNDVQVTVSRMHESRIRVRYGYAETEYVSVAYLSFDK